MKRRRPLALMLIAVMPFGVAVQVSAQAVLVVKVASSAASTDGQAITITTPSGQTFTVRATDIDIEASKELTTQRAAGSMPSRPAPGLPTDSAAAPGIRTKCASEWPDDFQMRAFCEKQQKEGLAKLRGRSMTSTNERMIRSKCDSDWPADFLMRNFCEEQQLNAMRELGQ